MLNKERKQLSQALSNFYQKPVARVSIELFLSVGAVLFFAIFAIRPTLLTMSELIKEIEDKRSLDKQMAQKIASLSSAQSEFIKNEDRFAVLDAAVPTNPDLVGLFKILEKLASENLLAITALSISDVPKNMDEKTDFGLMERKNLIFNISVTGDYSSIRNFVAELAKAQRTIVVEKVIFSVSDVRGAKRLDAVITLNAPYYGIKK